MGRYLIDTSRFYVSSEKRRIAPLDYSHLKSGAALIQVRQEDSLRLRNSVHRFSRYFRREFHYDFVQYDPHESGEGLAAFLFGSPFGSYDHGDAFGACCFRLRDPVEGRPSGWALQWIWLHPYFRNKGHLKSAWPIFQGQFGDRFEVEEPLSPAMKAFVSKRGGDK